MKNMLLIVLAAAALTAGGCAANKTTKQQAEMQPTESHTKGMIAGGYSEQRPLTAEDKAVFKTALQDLTGVGYKPVSVATQVVAGRNYRFICDATTVTREPQHFKAEVVIFQPLPGQGEPKITSIKRL